MINLLSMVLRDGKITINQNKKKLSSTDLPIELYSTNPNDVWDKNCVKQSTTMYHKYSPLRAAVSRLTDYTIGTGVRFNAQPSMEVLDAAKPDDVLAFARKFEQLVSLVFVNQNFYEKQALLFSNALIQGDALLYVNKDEGSFELSVKQGAHINAEKHPEQLGMFVQNNRPLGCYINGQKNPVLFQDQKQGLQLIHFHIPEFSEQLRGYPLAYSMFETAQRHHMFLNATAAKAHMESLFFGITNESDSTITEQIQQAAHKLKPQHAEGESNAPQQNTRPLDMLQNKPGSLIFSGQHGDKIQEVKNQTPGNTFGEFNQWIINLFAMATGVSPGILMADHRDNNYSGAKAEQDYTFKRILRLRSTFVSRVLRPTITDLFKHLETQKLITAPKGIDSKNPLILQALLSGQFVGPKFSAINPLQEARAAIARIDAGLSLPEDGLDSESGQIDFEGHCKKWARQRKMLEENQEKKDDKN